ncbi:STAS domain-containing protein [bacterium]|nr:STAS domain-containing protein [bacterium]
MKKINVNVQNSSINTECTVIDVEGFLDAYTVAELEETFNRLIKEQKFKLIVNLAKLDYISSAGLGTFMGVIDEIRDNDGDIILINLSPKIFKVFDLLGFSELFEIVDNEAAAVAKFIEGQ